MLLFSLFCFWFVFFSCCIFIKKSRAPESFAINKKMANVFGPCFVFVFVLFNVHVYAGNAESHYRLLYSPGNIQQIESDNLKYKFYINKLIFFFYIHLTWKNIGCKSKHSKHEIWQRKISIIIGKQGCLYHWAESIQ